MLSGLPEHSGIIQIQSLRMNTRTSQLVFQLRVPTAGRTCLGDSLYMRLAWGLSLITQASRRHESALNDVRTSSSRRRSQARAHAQMLLDRPAQET